MTNIELKTILESVGYETAEYSGRGMYGKTCISVHTSESLFEIGYRVGQATEQIFKGSLRPSRDQLGKGYVIYWPMMEWPKEVA